MGFICTKRTLTLLVTVEESHPGREEDLIAFKALNEKLKEFEDEVAEKLNEQFGSYATFNVNIQKVSGDTNSWSEH